MVHLMQSRDPKKTKVGDSPTVNTRGVTTRELLLYSLYYRFRKLSFRVLKIHSVPCFDKVQFIKVVPK